MELSNTNSNFVGHEGGESLHVSSVLETLPRVIVHGEVVVTVGLLFDSHQIAGIMSTFLLARDTGAHTIGDTDKNRFGGLNVYGKVV